MTTALAGGHLLEEIEGVITGIQSKDWIDTTLSAGVGALETAAFVIDPIGQALAAGVSWLIEHVPALNEPLHHLTGDIAALNAHADGWDRTAAGLHEQDRFLNDRSATLSHDWTGASADAFQGQIGLRRLAIRCAEFGAKAIALALRAGAALVQGVYVLVRDTVAQIGGGGLGAALKTLASGGIIAPVAVAQIGTSVQAATAKISALVIKVGASIGRLISKYLTKLKSLIDSVMSNVKNLGENARTASTADTHIQLADVGKFLGKDRQALRDYTAKNGHRRLNKMLRGELKTTPAEIASLNKKADSISTALAKLPPHEGVTYRGTNLSDVKLANYVEGKVNTERAFMSTSANVDGFIADADGAFDKNTYFIITGHTGRDIAPYSRAEYEAEVLYNRGSEFLVTSKKWHPELGKWMIVMKEVQK